MSTLSLHHPTYPSHPLHYSSPHYSFYCPSAHHSPCHSSVCYVRYSLCYADLHNWLQTRGPTRQAHVWPAIIRSGWYVPLPHTSHIVCPLICHTKIQGWGLSSYGMEYLFSADIIKRFAYKNDIDLITYIYQLAMEGFKLIFNCTIITIWNMPNYYYR